MTQQIDNTESAETELIPDSSIDSSPELSQESYLAQRERMRLLIAELVKTNQELRFRIARLKERVVQLEKGQRDDVHWAGMHI